MSNYKFLNFIPQKNDPKCFGVAEILAFDKIVLRYKIIPRKDNSGYFPATSSIKVVEFGQEKYINAFTIDSNYENQQIVDLVMKNVKSHMGGNSQNNIPQSSDEFPF